MLLYRFFIIIFILSIPVFKFQSLAMQMPAISGKLPDASDTQRFALAESYNELRLSVNNKQSVENFSNALDNFINSIMLPIGTNYQHGQIIINYNQANFLKRAIMTLEKLSQVNNEFLNKNLEDHLKTLEARIDLARIDENVRLGNGVRNSFDHPNLSVNSRNSLINLTGRVFQIKVDTNSNFDLLSTSSAALANYNHAGVNLANKLPQLTPMSHQVLNCIVTCAHGLESHEDYRAYRTETYFVPSSNIDLVSGLPSGIPLGNLGDLINYLRSNQNSFKITNIYIQNKRNPAPLNRFFDIDMTMSEPQYFSDNEDCVIAVIIPNAPHGVLPTYRRLSETRGYWGK